MRARDTGRPRRVCALRGTRIAARSRRWRHLPAADGVRCESRSHPLANREFLFPFASVVEVPPADAPLPRRSARAGRDGTHERSRRSPRCSHRPTVDRLNVGPIPTTQIGWDQPHEGNLFEHLYARRRSSQRAAAAEAVRSMRILSLTAGAASMYCGSCLRDNALAAELLARGHDVVAAPVLYADADRRAQRQPAPAFSSAASASSSSSTSPFFRRTPRFLDRLLDAEWVISMAATADQGRPEDPWG